eukprot:2493868-Amphidinium_carterae.2
MVDRWPFPFSFTFSSFRFCIFNHLHTCRCLGKEPICFFFTDMKRQPFLPFTKVVAALSDLQAAAAGKLLLEVAL